MDRMGNEDLVKAGIFKWRRSRIGLYEFNVAKPRPLPG